MKTQADRINQTSSKSVIAIGKDLLAVKRYLAHGQFVAWVECEAGIPARTAQAYMRVATWSTHRSPSVARLPPSVLYLISARGAPEHLLEELLQRIEAGERISAHGVRREMASSRNTRDRIDSNREVAAASVTPIDAGVPSIDTDSSIEEAVSILASRLSSSDFVRVKHILTNAASLAGASLAQKIVVAFDGHDAPMEHPEIMTSSFYGASSMPLGSI